MLTPTAQTTLFEKSDHGDISPAAMAAFYRSCGGDYDQLFLDMPPQSIAFIYARLECPHSLQPAAATAFCLPTVPALKQRGFVRWQTVQLLLAPAEHVPFIQTALRYFDVRDPDTGTAFPKSIPSVAFPSKPDPEMVAWHETISNRLRIEAEQVRPISQASSTDVSQDEAASTADERADAAHFFANPLYRNKEGKPAIVRQLTKAPAKMLQSGMSVAQNVLHGGMMILSPNTFGGPVRRKSRSRSPSRGKDGGRAHNSHGGRYPSDSSGPGRATSSPRPHPSSHRRRGASPNHSSDDAPDRGAEGEAYEHERRRQMRRRRSHDARDDAANSPGDYDRGPRRHRSVEYAQAPAPASGDRRSRPAPSSIYQSAEDRNRNFRPSTSPPLAAKLAQQQQQHGAGAHHRQDYFGAAGQPQAQYPQGRRPSMPYRTTSESNQYDRRGAAPMSADGTGGGGSHFKLTPNTQEEWDGIRQTVSGAAAEGPGARMGVRFAAAEDYNNNHSNNDTPTQERRPSAGTIGSGSGGGGSGSGQSARVNGVKGRRYPNEAPWS